MTADDLQDALAQQVARAAGPRHHHGTNPGRDLRLRRRDARRTSSGCSQACSAAPARCSRRGGWALFISDGTTVKYRQAQTWSLVRKPPLIIDGATAPTGGWPDYRTKFVNDARAKFGADRDRRRADRARIDLKTMLTNAAQNATTTFGPSFFLEEGIDIFPQGSQTAAEAAASLKPRSNGDPVTATPKTASELDDTTVVTTISGADAFPADAAKTEVRDHRRGSGAGHRPGRVDRRGARLSARDDERGQRSLVRADRRWTAAREAAAVGTGTPSAELQAAIAELLADGAAQADVDALLAALPQGEAAEDAAPDDSDPAETWEFDGYDYLDPEEGLA